MTVSDTIQYQKIQEGKAEILFPQNQEVFYNPVQQFNRDMSIAAIKTWASMDRQQRLASKKLSSEEPKYRVLEALAASGLRSIRYAKEIGGLDQVVANDLSEEAVESITRNVAHNDVSNIVIPNQGDASGYMYQCRDPSKRFHIVDLDPYGTAAPFIDAAVQSVTDGGLLCVTCTDLAVLCGNYPETS